MNIRGMNEKDTVSVVGLDKNTGFVSAFTSTEVRYASKMAKYYRSIGYNARIVSDEELDELYERERKMIDAQRRAVGGW